jgi:hypothetical protein
MTGVECPRPGISTFHATLAVSLHFTGGVPAATPFPDGPRHCGQCALDGARCCAAIVRTESATARTVAAWIRHDFIFHPYNERWTFTTEERSFSVVEILRCRYLASTMTVTDDPRL